MFILSFHIPDCQRTIRPFQEKEQCDIRFLPHGSSASPFADKCFRRRPSCRCQPPCGAATDGTDSVRCGGDSQEPVPCPVSPGRQARISFPLLHTAVLLSFPNCSIVCFFFLSSVNVFAANIINNIYIIYKYCNILIYMLHKSFCYHLVIALFGSLFFPVASTISVFLIRSSSITT